MIFQVFLFINIQKPYLSETIKGFSDFANLSYYLLFSSNCPLQWISSPSASVPGPRGKGVPETKTLNSNQGTSFQYNLEKNDWEEHKEIWALSANDATIWNSLMNWGLDIIFQKSIYSGKKTVSYNPDYIWILISQERVMGGPHAWYRRHSGMPT